MKIKKRITVVIDAEFGVDKNDEWDEDKNAYTPGARHENILGAVADGTATDPDRPATNIELGTGDVVRGDLVSIDVADTPAT